MHPTPRYHPLLVILHWTLAALILAMLALGFLWLRPTPNTDPQKLLVLELHMAVGLSILALMLVRLAVRFSTARPAPASAGAGFLDRLTAITHGGFYVLVVLMAGTGAATAMLAGLPRIVFEHSAALPRSFTVFPTFVAHTLLAELLTVLILLHVLGALYHQLIRRNGLINRMSFGRPS